MRHADAGYDLARSTTARERGVDLPMIRPVMRRCRPHEHRRCSPPAVPAGAQGDVHRHRATRRWPGTAGAIRWVGPERRAARARSPATEPRTPGGAAGDSRAWSTATPISPSAAGAPTNSSSALSGATYLEIAARGRRHRVDRAADPRRARGGARWRAAERFLARDGASSASPRSSARAATDSIVDTELRLLRVYRDARRIEPAAARAHLARRARGSAGVPRHRDRLRPAR